MAQLPGFAEGAEPPGLDELIETFPDDSDKIAEDLRKHLAEGGFEAAPDWLRGLQAQAIKAPPGGLTRDNAGAYADGIRRIYQKLWDITEAQPGNRLKRPYPAFTPLGGAETRSGDKRGTVVLIQVGGRIFPGGNTGLWLTDEQTKGARQNKLPGRVLRDLFGLPENATSPAWHAEGQALLRAFLQTKGALPKTLEMFTDRENCRECQKFLPDLMEDIGVDKIDVTNIQTGNITRIWRSGLGPR